MNRNIALLLSSATLAFAAGTQAAPPHTPDLTSSGNRWLVTAYLDSSPSHSQLATQGLCFYNLGIVGTQQMYYWVSDTFPDWNGIATQEGDQIFMHGDYAEDIGHDGMQWQVVSASRENIGAGHWHEWREDGKFGDTIGFANALFKRVGKCEFSTADEALEAYRAIDYPTDEKGNRLTLPLGIIDQ
ncbi:hypothetical protein [Halioxenophilus sp. WMMB6]|uniref:hypothetical protein n=1 Tax=Halioxenophilus sp. WMMB6 TaxID=3073815 RepID=UPI00295E4AE2|nr:hypothetical protein [Halioxenophilus sp. WMMB6]